MKLASTIARYLLGVAFTVFGLNGFLHFIPQPPFPAGSPAGAFMGAMAGTGFLVVVFAIQLLCGLLFLGNRFVTLALVLIAPVIVNILLFHATMAPTGLPPGVVVAAAWAIVAWRYREAFESLWRPQLRA